MDTLVFFSCYVVNSARVLGHHTVLAIVRLVNILWVDMSDNKCTLATVPIYSNIWDAKTLKEEYLVLNALWHW